MTVRIPIGDGAPDGAPEDHAIYAARQREFFTYLKSLPSASGDSYTVAMLADRLVSRHADHPHPELDGAFQYIRERLGVPVH